MSDDLTPAQLDEIEAAAKDEMDSGWRIVLMNPAATLALVTEVREMRAKVERVRELHYQPPEDGGYWCACGSARSHDPAPDHLQRRAHP